MFTHGGPSETQAKNLFKDETRQRGRPQILGPRRALDLPLNVLLKSPALLCCKLHRTGKLVQEEWCCGVRGLAP